MASSLGVFNACREGAVETDLCRRSKIKDGDMDHVEAFLRIECSKVSPRFARTFLIADQHHDNRHLLLLESVQRRPLRIKISKRHRAAKNTTPQTQRQFRERDGFPSCHTGQIVL
ncbi:MAG: hypothetical protein AUI96_05230 [Nitrospirae bacterium 13_1_40CM_3_62_11]|nr:MAG: hypothetical protein AUI96_05230 [Nitrospirae bacterium 13_1_40CM_3_62_11]